MNAIRVSCLKKVAITRVCVVVASLSFALALPAAAYGSEEEALAGDSSVPALVGNADAPVSIEAPHPTSGWEYDQSYDRWFYYRESVLVKGWLYVGGFWYWFDDEGIMAVGLTECGSQTYYLNTGSDTSIPCGAMKTGWVACDDGWCFFDVSGAMERCWLFDGSNWYWLDSETGVMATGVTQCGSSSYCFNASGSMVVGWACDGGVWYYAAPSGELQGGWQYVWGAWYYAKASGHMAGGSWYYSSESSCAMQTGWIDVNGTWYYTNASGRMETGWFASGGAWYWFDGNGAMATGWQWIDGSWYCFKSNGVWFSDSMNAKAQSYASRTNWLILVDTPRCVTSIYCGSQGNWDLNRRYVCSTGRAGTPTVIGEYEVFGKGYSFGHGYTCYYYTQFYGDYLFHSSPYYVNSNRIKDPTMGVPSSAGCVRLEIQNAKWIYDNIPYGTKVVTYN
mgnify:CR=1 FL=1